MKKSLSCPLLALLCFALFSCGECQGAKNATSEPTTSPAIPSEPINGENEDTQEDANLPSTPEQPTQTPSTDEPPKETPEAGDTTTSPEAQPPEQGSTDEPPKESPETGDGADDGEKQPEQTILTTSEDTIEIPASKTLVYRFEANRAGILSVVSEDDCVITVKRLLANGEETPVATPEEYAVQAGDVFLITVENPSEKVATWCIFLEP